METERNSQSRSRKLAKLYSQIGQESGRSGGVDVEEGSTKVRQIKSTCLLGGTREAPLSPHLSGDI
jgi:hypothetical protein